MYQQSAFKIEPVPLRSEPTIYLTPDAPIDAIRQWLDTVLPQEEIDFVWWDLEDQTLIIFDLPKWAALTYATWADFVEKLQ